MARIHLIETRDAASIDQVETFDYIVASRGKMLRPFAAMLHRPRIARAAADLGAVIRYQGTLSDADRELTICTVAIERNCDYEWQSHRPIAESAGVLSLTLDEVASRSEVTDRSASQLVAFVRELCRESDVSDETYEQLEPRLGEGGIVEVAATVGYYSMIAMILATSQAC